MSKIHNQHRSKWQRLRNRVLKQHKFLCINPFGLHSEIREAKEVHHILPAEDYKENFFNINNLIPLCPECHTEAHRLLRTNRTEYLKYFNIFDFTQKKRGGDEKSLQVCDSSPNSALFLEISNENGQCFNKNPNKSSNHCFYDPTKGQYYCSCLRKYKNFPCSKCHDLLTTN